MARRTRTSGAVGIAVAVSALLLVSSAQGYSGSITNITPNPDGSVSATYSSTLSFAEACFTDVDICGWYALAWQIPSTETCGAEDDTHLAYVSTYQNTDGSLAETGIFYPAYPSVRLCLKASSVISDYLLADAVYAAPSAQPPTTPPPSTRPPAPAPPPVETLTLSDAHGTVRLALRRKFGGKFTHRSSYRTACGRLSRIKIRCRTAWYHQGRWRATVTVRGLVRNGQQYVAWSISGIHHPAKRRPPTTPPPASPPPSTNFCDTHACIPNFDNGTGYIVQCNDGMWSHSGGRPGACSGHGGESDITASRSALRRAHRDAVKALNHGALPRG